MKKLVVLSLFILAYTNVMSDVNVVVKDNGSIIGSKKENSITDPKKSSILIGNDSTLTKSGIVLGSYSNGTEGSIVVGTGSKIIKVGKETSVVIGDNSGTSTSKAVVIGSGTFSNRSYSVTIGDSAFSDGGNNVVVGEHSYAGREAVSIGEHTKAYGINSTAVGRRALSLGDESVAVGVDSKSYSKFSVSMGNSASTKGKSSIALGPSSQANLENSTAIGGYSKVNSYEGVSLGYGSENNRDAYVEGYNPDDDDNTVYISNSAKEKIAAKKEKEQKLKDYNNIFDKDLVEKYRRYLIQKRDTELKSLNASDKLKEKLNASLKTKGDDFKNTFKQKCAGQDAEVCNLDFTDEANTPEKIVEKYKKDYEKLYDEHKRVVVSVDQSGMVSRKGAVSVGNEDKKEYRQIIGVAAGSKDTDAVNVLQLKKLKQFTETKIEKLDTKIEGLETEVGKIDTKVGNLEIKVDKIDTRVENVETEIVNIKGNVTSLSELVNDHSNKFIEIENKLVENKADLKKINNRIDDVEKMSRKSLGGVANAIAMANLPQVNTANGKIGSISGAVSYYEGVRSIALGVSGASKEGNFVYRASGAVNSRRNVGLGLGVSYQFGSGVNMYSENEMLRKENAENKKMINTLLQRIERLESIIK